MVIVTHDDLGTKSSMPISMGTIYVNIDDNVSVYIYIYVLLIIYNDIMYMYTKNNLPIIK